FPTRRSSDLLFLERHHQFHGVQRIRAEVVHERRAVGDVLFLDAQLFDDDLLDALFDVAHVWLLLPGIGSMASVRESRPGQAPPPGVGHQGMYMPPLTCRVSPVM